MRRLLVGVLLACAAAAPAPAPVVSPVALEARTDSGEPVLSTSSDGRLVLSWMEPAGGNRHALRWCRWQGEGWGPPSTALALDRLFVNWADVPAVVPTQGDTLIAYVLRRTGSGPYDYAVLVSCSSDDGAHWTAPRPLHGGSKRGEHGFVSVVPAPGGADVVWLDGRAMVTDPDEGAMALRHAFVSADGTVGAETRLDARTCECCRTGLARTRDGLVAVYRDRSERELRDVAAVRLLEGDWSDPSPVAHDGWRTPACPVNGPVLVAAGDTLFVAWSTVVADTPHVHAAWSLDGGRSYGPALRLDEGAPTGRSCVVLLPGGEAVLAWIEGERADARLRVRRVRPDGSAAEPLTVTTTGAARRAGFPRMARTGDALVFAWTEAGPPTRVRSARLPLAALPR
ncbi:MAG: hypothetical protein RL721_384 [Candidatus Eisenbacteria bacterium]